MYVFFLVFTRKSRDLVIFFIAAEQDSVKAKDKVEDIESAIRFFCSGN